MEKFEADSGVPILQASLAISQTHLPVAETQLSEQDLELQRQKIALGRLVNLYPSAAAAATSLQTAGITGEALQAYAALYANREATKRTVSGLENRLAELIKHTVTLSTTIAAETVPATSATQRLEQAAIDQELSE